MTSQQAASMAAVTLAALSLAGCSNATSPPSLAVTGGGELSAAPSMQPAATPPGPAPVVATSSTPNAIAPRTPGAVFDVDGDGTPDSVTTRFVGKHSAVLVVRLGTEKSLTSKTFQLFPGDGAGTVVGFDVNGDHRSEVFVEAPGADGVGYDLFSYVGSTIAAVPAPKGQAVPYLYIGGGRYYESTFRCTSDHLVQVKEQPAVADTASLPADPPYRVTTTAWALAGGRLTMTASHTVRAADHAAAQRLLDGASDGCGTTP
jgi:hypothetical protein